MLVPITQNSDSIFLYFLKWSSQWIKLWSVTKVRYYIVVHCIPHIEHFMFMTHLFYSWHFVPQSPSPFTFVSSPPPLWLTLVSSLYLYVCFCFVTFFHLFFLDSTYKWNRTVFVILWFTSLMIIPLTQDLKFLIFWLIIM